MISERQVRQEQNKSEHYKTLQISLESQNQVSLWKHSNTHVGYIVYNQNIKKNK